MAYESKKHVHDDTLTRRGETLRFRIKRSLLPDLENLKAQGNLYGNDDCNVSRQIVTSADVDFVLVAHRRSKNRDEHGKYTKNASSFKSLEFRLGNTLSKCFSKAPTITDDDFERARLIYLAKLQQVYGLTIVQVDYDFDSRDRDGDGLDDDGVVRSYYLIKGAFAHFGLMAQLMSYQWPLNNDHLLKMQEELKSLLTQQSEPDRVVGSTSITIASPTIRNINENLLKNVYKSFYFYKRGKERYRDYKNCQQRLDFEESTRYDLMYHLLAGAALPMPRLMNPWRNIISSTADLKREERESEKYSKEVALMHFLADEIFDDWLILHEPLKWHYEPGSHDSDESQRSCCATCCFPMMTCSCRRKQTSPEQNQTNENAENQNSKSWGALSYVRELWDSFWYRNCIDSSEIRRNSEENDRSYLYRISTLRNALSLKRFRGATDDEEKLVKLYHVMPLFEIRRYFGEKIGFYFAWVEFFTYTLIIPAVIGIGFFLVALIYFAITMTLFVDEQEEERQREVVMITTLGTRILAKACDNISTPFFAAVMVIWGTAFSELWHKRSCWYQYLWRVDNVEATEFERPQDNRPTWVKALVRSRWGGRYLLYAPSVIVTLFFCGCVFSSVYFVNVINTFSFPYCLRNGTMSPDAIIDAVTTISPNDSMLEPPPEKTTQDVIICTSFDALRVIINSVSILILDIIYTSIVYLLTDMECHSTQTQYNDALILKLFMFRFVNAYSILFFIAFAVAPNLVQYPSSIVGELSGPEKEVLFGCNGRDNCMALLTKQLLGSILTKPLFKSLVDVLMPRVMALIRILFRPKDAQSDSSVSAVNYGKLAKKSKRKVTNVNQISPLSSEDSARVNLEMAAVRPSLQRQAMSLPPLRKLQDQPIQSQPLGQVVPSSTSPLPVPLDDEESKQKLNKLIERVEEEYLMPKLSTLDRKEFTQMEYMDRVISYGALLMFSVALPPAPLLTLLIVRMDCFLDIGRMVSDYRRPLPFRAQDIGIWEKIVNFLTYCGILTNPLVCILTSTWGSQLSVTWQFWTFLLFEHGMFLIRMVSTSLINEVPPELAKAKIRSKRYKDEVIASLTIVENTNEDRASVTSDRKHRRNRKLRTQAEIEEEPGDFLTAAAGLYPKI